MNAMAADKVRFKPSPSAAAVGETLVLRVGPNKKEYTLHVKLLEYHCDYYSSAIMGNPEEISAGSDPLRNVDTVVFDAFVDWLYKGSVPKSLHTTLLASPHKNAPISLQWPLYILADLVLANELKWAIFKMVFTNYAESDNVPEIALVVYLSKHLVADDVMLRLLSDVLCINDGILVWQRVPQEELYDVPKAFFIRALYKRNTMNDFMEKDEKAVLQLEDYNLEPPKEIVFWK